MSSIFKNKIGIIANCWLLLFIASLGAGSYTYYHADEFDKGKPTYSEEDPFDTSQNPLFTEIEEQPKQAAGQQTSIKVEPKQTVAQSNSSSSLLVPVVRTSEGENHEEYDHEHEGHNHGQGNEEMEIDLTKAPPYGMSEAELNTYHISPSDPNYIPQGFDKDDDTFFIDSRTGQYNSKDSYLNYIHRAVSKEEAVASFHIPTDKKIKSIESVNLDITFRGDALRLAKQDVMAHYNYILSKDIPNADFRYSSDTNIIYVVLKDTAVGNVNNMVIPMGCFDSYTIYNEYDPCVLKNYAIAPQEGSETLKVTTSAGYNGNLQIIANNIPYVVMYNPAIEPLFAGQDLSKYVDMLTNYVFEVENPHYNLGSNKVYDNSYLSTNIKVEDNDSEFWGDADSYVDNTQTIEATPEVQTDADVRLNEIKTRLEKQKEENMKIPTSLWGTKVSDAQDYKDNIKDGSDVSTFKGIKLDIVDINGNQKDMVQETINTKPAGIKTTQIIQVSSEDKTATIPVITYFCILAAILSLIIYIYYVKLFIENYKRDLEIKGLDGISDTLDTMNFKKIDADSILLDGGSVLTDSEKDAFKRLRQD